MTKARLHTDVHHINTGTYFFLYYSKNKILSVPLQITLSNGSDREQKLSIVCKKCNRILTETHTSLSLNSFILGPSILKFTYKRRSSNLWKQR